MAKKQEPVPGWIYRCDELDARRGAYRGIRVYGNRYEVDRATAFLHRYKRTDSRSLKDVVGVQHKPGKKLVTLTLPLITSDLIWFKRRDDAERFAEVMAGVIGR